MRRGRGAVARIACAATWALLASPLGCDPAEPIPRAPEDHVGLDVPMPITELCPTLAESACAALRPCCEASPWSFDEARCRVVARAACEARKTRALGHSELHYDPVLAARCARRIGALVQGCQRTRASQDVDAFEVDAACQRIFHGPVPPYVHCDGDSRSCDQRADRLYMCGPGLSCLPVELLMAGEACAPVGPRCDAAVCQCAPGLTCQGTPGRCSASPHPLGGTCERLETQQSPISTECGRSRYCAFDHTCARLPGLGEACASANGGAKLCALGYRCETDGSRTCIEGKSLGAICGASSECASGECDPQQEICVPSDVTSPAVCDGLIFTDLGGFLAVPTYGQGM